MPSAIGCELFVTHNSKQTRFFKLVPGLPGESVASEYRSSLGKPFETSKIRIAVPKANWYTSSSRWL